DPAGVAAADRAAVGSRSGVRSSVRSGGGFQRGRDGTDQPGVDRQARARGGLVDLRFELLGEPERDPGGGPGVVLGIRVRRAYAHVDFEGLDEGALEARTALRRL